MGKRRKKLHKQIKLLQKQLEDCLGVEESNKRSRDTDESIVYVDSSDDTGAVDSKNILSRKRVRLKRKENDVVDNDLLKDAEREAVTVVREVLENELVAFQAQEAMLKGTGDVATAQEQLSEYANLNDAGLRSRIYGSTITTTSNELDAKINAISASILLIIQNKNLDNVAETLYSVVYWEALDIRTILDKENNWEIILDATYENDELVDMNTRVLSHEEQEAIFKSTRDWDNLSELEKKALLASVASASEEEYVVESSVDSDVDIVELCRVSVLKF